MATLLQSVKRLSVIDESLLATTAQSCNLYIHAALPSISFALLDRNRNKFIVICEYRLGEENAEELRSLLKQDEILAEKEYHSVTISFTGNRSVLVPQTMYSEESAEKMLTITSGSHHDEQLAADKLKYTDAVHVYALPWTFNVFRSHYRKCKVVHAGSVLMESELLRNKNNTDPAIAVNVRQGSYDVVITTGSRLNYYNSFTYNSSEDFIYYLLYIMEQMKLNPERTKVRFTGDIDKHMAPFLITAKYVRNLSFGSRPESFEFSYGFSQVNQHAHAVLLNQYLCES